MAMLLSLPRERPRPRPQLTQLPKRERHAIHAYHDVSPWSPDERLLAYTSVDDTGAGSIVVHDMTSGEARILQAHAAYDFHTGADIRWALGGRALLCRVRDTATARPVTALVDVNAGSCHITPELRDLRVREVIDAGHLAIAAGPLNARHAIFAIDLRDDSRDVLLDADRIARELPTQLALPAEQIGFDHPLLSADGDWLFVKIMAHVAGARRFHSVVLYHRGTDQLHVHGAEISGHPVWHPRDPVIYNIRQTRDGADNRHIVAVDPASGDFTRVLETPIEGPGHLSFSPDGRWLITDAFCADQRTCPIYAIDMRSRTCRELMRLRHHSELGNYHSFWRGQPHPAFSPSGRQFAFNCNAGTDTMSIWIAAAPEPSDSEAQA